MNKIKLSTLKAKPTLIEKLIDDEMVVKELGGVLQFWTWDRVPLETYMQLVSAEADDVKLRFEIAKKLILEEDGSPMLVDDEVFTPAVMTLVVAEVFNGMGNLSAGNQTGKTPQ